MLRRSLLLFFALIAAFALIAESAIIAFGFTRLLVTALMWSVALAAILTLKITGQPLASLGWSWGPAKHHLIALLLPIGYGGVAYGVAGAIGLARFPTAAGAHKIVLSENFQALSRAVGPAHRPFTDRDGGPRPRNDYRSTPEASGRPPLCMLRTTCSFKACLIR
jgi:hypothetical protein